MSGPVRAGLAVVVAVMVALTGGSPAWAESPAAHDAVAESVDRSSEVGSLDASDLDGSVDPLDGLPSDVLPDVCVVGHSGNDDSKSASEPTSEPTSDPSAAGASDGVEDVPSERAVDVAEEPLKADEEGTEAEPVEAPVPAETPDEEEADESDEVSESEVEASTEESVDGPSEDAGGESEEETVAEEAPDEAMSDEDRGSTAEFVAACPVAPVDLAAEPGVNAVELTWVAGQVPEGDARFGMPLAYFVTVTGPELRVLRTSQTQLNVTGLRNGVPYEFSVYAATRFGRSDAAGPIQASPTTGMEGVVAGLIVEFEPGAAPTEPDATIPGEDRIDLVDLTLGDRVTDDAVLVELSESVDLPTAERIAAELSQHDAVSWAEPDQFFFTSSEPDIAQTISVPTDPRYVSDQWNLWDDFGVSIGDSPTSMTAAWSGARGDGVSVAVIDTGITPHPDLDAQVISGYDFVSSPESLASRRSPDASDVPFDGDYVNEDAYGSVGRDPNPSDPGDWRGIMPVRDSSWHGSKIAGLIAAVANDDGITGIAPNATIQPIRALSWRGGLLSDIAASITWASGGDIDGVPSNVKPSKVINMSFAVETGCPATLQLAIDGARARGSVLVAAAGNASDDATKFAPGNCNGVITVAATNRDGQRAGYSNYGASIDLAAPGGDAVHPIPTTTNAGNEGPTSPTTTSDFGTSIAAAHVSAAAALLISRKEFTSPREVFEQLTGRSFTKAFANDVCDAVHPDYTCGTGILSLGLAQTASTTCSRTESNLVGNGAGGTLIGQSYVLVTFSTVGSCSWAPPRGVTQIDYLIVGGGGGGGSARSGYAAGGGGGGEVVAGTGMSVSSSSSITVQVGAGGVRSTNGSAAGGTGGSSGLGLVTARGGGGGASGVVSPRTYATTGFTGGGGGGFSSSYNNVGAGVSPLKGGNGVVSSSRSYISGGGGAGAGGNGANGSTSRGGAGGAGVASLISGASVRYGGGGGGGKRYSGSAGAGADGGGSGGVNNVAGSAVSGRGGGGGGAGSNTTTTRAGGTGGSGVVIVRFATPIPDVVTLQYDANGGTGAPSQQSETADTSVTISATQPTRAGFTFRTWNTARDGSGTSYNPGATFTMPWSELTLYAQWDVIGFLITYDANEGQDPPDAQAANSGTTITIASQGSMTNTGYAFTGWNTSADGSGTARAAGSTMTVTNHVILHAQWLIQSFTVTYDANGGTSAPTSQTAAFGTELTLSAAQPSRSGYSFTGWTAESSGAGSVYQPGGSLTIAAENVTLYAQWTPNTQVLTYGANGGDGAPSSQITYAFASLTVSGVQPTRVGHRFASWNAAIDGSGNSYAPESALVMPAANLTLYAQWTPITYTVSFDANGGSGSPDPESKAYGASFTLSLADPTRAGHTFNGWNTAANGSGATWNSGTTFTVSGDVTLHAQWIANVYTLRYNTNGGVGSPDPEQVANGANATVSAMRPTRTGYTFTGWNTKRDGSGTALATSAAFVMPPGDVTLFAQWSSSTYTLAYNANGGTGTAPTSTSLSYLGSSAVSSPTLLTRTGYAFTEWNTAADGTGTSYSPGATFVMPAANVTLYAQWFANANALIYDANGGSGGPGTLAANTGEVITVSASAPTRTGYTFANWLDFAGDVLEAGETFTMPSNSAVLRAQWTVNSYDLSYSANEGAGAPSGSTEVFGATVTASSTEPTRFGYVFASWNTAANGSGSSYPAGSTFTMPATNTTLFAQWIGASNTVFYDANGGAGGPGSTSARTASTVTVSALAPTRAGYDFLRWNTAAGGTGTAYAAGDTFTMPSLSVSLYAQWTAALNAVSYDANGGAGGPGSTSARTASTVTVSSVAPTRAGYDFLGWNTAANGAGTFYSAGDTFTMSTSSLSLFAQWRAVPPQSSANASRGASDSGSSNAAPVSVTCRSSLCASIRRPRPLPTLPAQVTGSGVVTEGEKTIVVAVKPVSGSTRVEARGEGFGVALQSANPAGAAVAVPSDQRLVLPEGGRLEAAGDGYMADSVLRVFMIPNTTSTSTRAPRSITSSVDLGEVPVNDRGEFASSLTVPWGIENGAYILQLNGISPAAEVRSLNINVVVKRSRVSVDLDVVSRAGFFGGKSDRVSADGREKLHDLVAAMPVGARLVQVMVSGVSVSLDSPRANHALAIDRSERLVRALAVAGLAIDAVPIVYTTVSETVANAGSVALAHVLSDGEGKPLSTLTLVFEIPDEG